MELKTRSLVILLTCVGSPIIPKIVSLIRGYPDANIKVVGIDSKSLESGVGGYFCDKFVQAPNGSENNYNEFVSNLIDQEGISIIFPCSDDEAVSLSQIKEDLYQRGVCVTSSSSMTSKLVSNKFKLFQFLDNVDIRLGKYGEFEDVDQILEVAQILGYPDNKLIFKPKIGRGSRGLRLIDSAASNHIDRFISNSYHIMTLAELVAVFESHPSKLCDYFLMEYLPGEKYSSDVLIENGRIVASVTRSNGYGVKIQPPTTRAKLVHEPDIDHYISNICKSIKFDYFAQFETGRNIDGDPSLIEINPRFDATLPITLGAGVNFYHEMIDYCLLGKFDNKLQNKINTVAFKDVTFMRWWDHIFIQDDQVG